MSTSLPQSLSSGELASSHPPGTRSSRSLPPSVLSRLQNFLPLMASANELLAAQDADELDIENVGDEEEQYVEMVSLAASLYVHARQDI